MLGARVGVGREVTFDKADAVARKKFFCAPARLASVTGEDFDIHLGYLGSRLPCAGDSRILIRAPDSEFPGALRIKHLHLARVEAE